MTHAARAHVAAGAVALAALLAGPQHAASDTAGRFESDPGDGTDRRCSLVVDAASATVTVSETHLIRYYKCFDRRIRLEVDLLTGIQGIPQTVNLGGINWDLWSVFNQIAIGVDVIQDDINIADTSGACFSLAEMDAFFTANQDAASSDPGDWNVWAGMVDCDDGNAFGRMFRSGANERDGFAVFVNAVTGSCFVNGGGCCGGGGLATANQAVLRTTAHELGHALNLCHDNGDDACADCAGTSIMNQTGNTGVGWGYVWSTAEQGHINTAAESCIEPGTSTAFSGCGTNPCGC